MFFDLSQISLYAHDYAQVSQEDSKQTRDKELLRLYASKFGHFIIRLVSLTFFPLFCIDMCAIKNDC